MNSSGLTSVSATPNASSSGVHPQKSRLDTIKNNLELLTSYEPDTVITINSHQGSHGKFYPVDAASQFFPDEFFERAKTVNASSLEPTHSIKAFRQIMKKGVPDSVLSHPHPILMQAAMTGSEKLFKLPWKYGARPLEKEESRTVLNKASKLFKQELERIKNHPPEGTPPENWKQWLTELDRRMRASRIRMNVIANGYERVHHFLYLLNKKVRETRSEILMKKDAAERKALSAPTKSAKRKARQKAKKAEAAALQATPSGKAGALNHSMTIKTSPSAHPPEAAIPIPNSETATSVQECSETLLSPKEISSSKKSTGSEKVTSQNKSSANPVTPGKKQAWQPVEQSNNTQNSPKEISSSKKSTGREKVTSQNKSSANPVTPGKKQVWQPVEQRDGKQNSPKGMAAVLQTKTEFSNAPNPPSEKPEATQVTLPSFEERLRDALALYHLQSHPLKPLEGINLEEARQFMQNRWDAVWKEAKNPNSGVVIYSSES